jgi:hypothetical protein
MTFEESDLPAGYHRLRIATFYEQALQASRKRCGRTTSRGTPCRAVLKWYQTACNDHATPVELDQALDILRRFR